MANKVSYVKNEEPAFLKAFKERVGYKEGPTVDSKREALAYEEDDRSDTEEEKPTVVVLKEGDLSAEQAEAELKQQKTDDDETGETEASDGRITFKKPSKRQSDSNNELQISSSKKQKDEKTKKKSSSKEVKNSSLLSFDDDENDDEDDT